VPITLSDGLSGERHKLTDTQIRASCKKQPGFATQSPRKRPIAALREMTQRAISDISHREIQPANGGRFTDARRGAAIDRSAPAISRRTGLKPAIWVTSVQMCLKTETSI
jgi:hypothetical protein